MEDDGMVELKTIVDVLNQEPFRYKANTTSLSVGFSFVHRTTIIFITNECSKLILPCTYPIERPTDYAVTLLSMGLSLVAVHNKTPLELLQLVNDIFTYLDPKMKRDLRDESEEVEQARKTHNQSKSIASGISIYQILSASVNPGI